MVRESTPLIRKPKAKPTGKATSIPVVPSSPPPAPLDPEPWWTVFGFKSGN